MRLFTSNFKQEAPILGLVALLLLACEIGLRRYAPRLSLDLQHIQAIPRIVSALKNSDGPTLLFIGNSLTRRAVVPERLTEALARHGFSKVHLAEIYPDDTNMADWHYIYERYVRSKRADPNDVLIGFAEEQLSDSQTLHIDRLGGFFAGLGAVSEAFRHDVRDFNGRIEYLLAGLSCAYANRDRVRTDLLGVIIPDYKSSAQVLNKALKNRGEASGTGTSRHYTRLTRFLELMKGGPTHVIFVAIPIPALYPIDPSLPSILAKNGAQLIDLHLMKDLTADDFLDGYHLSPRGALIFTRELARKLLGSGAFTRSLSTGVEPQKI